MSLSLILTLLCTINICNGVTFPRRMEDLAKLYRYNYENHTVTTDDGYILQLGRLPPGPNGCSDSKGVVLLGHGLRNNGELHLLQPDSLAYRLVKECYDVWLANNRGTRYSNKHEVFSKSDREFWQFSNDEMALLDLKGMVDYIRSVTGGLPIHYVGFSQSTSHFLMLCSARTEYQEYFQSAHLLAPVANARTAHSPHWLAQSKIIRKLILVPELINRPVITSDGLYQSLVVEVCSEEYKPVCRKFEKKQCPNAMDSRLWGSHFPDAFSFKSIAELLQWKQAGHLQKYDYGKEQNLQVYQSETPAVFNFSNIATKVVAYYALGDPFSTPSDVQMMADQLPNCQLHAVSQNRSAHGDCPSDAEHGIERLDTKVVDHINEINQLSI